MLFVDKERLEGLKHNIDSRVGGFTVFKQMYEIVGKITRFRQVCQLLLSLIVGTTRDY